MAAEGEATGSLMAAAPVMMAERIAALKEDNNFMIE
jgi:hypothetical protein